MKAYDWVNGPMPCNDLHIKYTKKKNQTPLVQRLQKQPRFASKTICGRNKKNIQLLNEIQYVAILKGELLNEEVLKIKLVNLTTKIPKSDS
jgi:hypothetical protein